MPNPYYWIFGFCALVLAQTMGSFAATSLVTGLDRTIVYLAAVPLITVLVCTTALFRGKWGILVVAAATATTF